MMCLGLLCARAWAADAPPLPDWNELQSLVRSNMAGLSAEDWNRVQVQGLLDQLRGEVVLVGQENAATNGPALARTEVIDEAYVYLRIARLEGGLEKAFAEALDRERAAHKIQGVVIDLRFADGSDYAAAAQVADRFVARDLALLDWGEQPARASSQTNDVEVPVAVLVNAQTAGTPEALAEMMRQSKAALILGATSAGRAHVFREFSLSNGQKVRIASAKVRLGNGDPMPPNGVQPDIEVAVKPGAERAYFEDPYKAIASESTTSRVASAPATNASPRRVNEAELMRQRREDTGGREPEPARTKPASAAKPAIQDPVLARAVDLLKGLAILRQAKSR